MGAWAHVTVSKSRVFLGLLIFFFGFFAMLGSIMTDENGETNDGLFIVGLIICFVGFFVAVSGQRRYWNKNASPER